MPKTKDNTQRLDEIDQKIKDLLKERRGRKRLLETEARKQTEKLTYAVGHAFMGFAKMAPEKASELCASLEPFLREGDEKIVTEFFRDALTKGTASAS